LATFPNDLLTQLGKARAKLAKDAEGFAAAEAHLLDAHENYSRNPGPSPKAARSRIEAIVEFCSARNQAEPDKRYDAKGSE
jgi:hypothetical protein